MKPIAAIVDYGLGNTASVATAFEQLGCRSVVTRDEKKMQSALAVVLPGVGAFGAAMRELERLQLKKILQKVVIEGRKPCLGICLGMQLLAEESEEHGIHQGLGWIPGKVRAFQPTPEFPVPHVGWNRIVGNAENPLFERCGTETNCYFDHGFYFEAKEKFVCGWTEYSVRFASAVRKDNVFGVQFHPEKSQRSGLKLLRGFLNYAATAKPV